MKSCKQLIISNLQDFLQSARYWADTGFSLNLSREELKLIVKQNMFISSDMRKPVTGGFLYKCQSGLLYDMFISLSPIIWDTLFFCWPLMTLSHSSGLYHTSPLICRQSTVRWNQYIIPSAARLAFAQFTFFFFVTDQ